MPQKIGTEELQCGCFSTRNPKLHAAAELHPTSSMNLFKQLLLICVFSVGIFGANWACAQATDPDLPDSPTHAASSKDPDNSPSNREASWRSLPKDFLLDQKAIWLFPAQLA